MTQKTDAAVREINSLADLTSAFGLTGAQQTRLLAFDELFCKTAAHTNLVARNSIADRWHRHYADSLQLVPFVPMGAQTLLDIGSGGGFPGLIVGAILADRIDPPTVSLIDSVAKKTRFLTEAVRAMQISNVSVITGRVERQAWSMSFDVVMARAVANLGGLLDLTVPLLSTGGMLIFPKGERVHDELEAARTRWTFHVKQCASRTRIGATILLLTEPRPTK